MFLLTLRDRKDDGAYAVQDQYGHKVLFLFEDEDDATRYALMLEDQEDQPNPHNVLNHGEPFGGRNKVRSLMVLDEGGNPIRYYKSKSAFTKDSGKRVSKTFNTVGEQLTLTVNSERLTLVAITLKDYNERVA